MREIIDAIVTVIFWGTLVFGGNTIYKVVATETVKVLQRGQNNLTPFTKSLTGKQFD